MGDIIYYGMCVMDSGSDKVWKISGEFRFDDRESYDEFVECIGAAFELTYDYTVDPVVMTRNEYNTMKKDISTALGWK